MLKYNVSLTKKTIKIKYKFKIKFNYFIVNSFLRQGRFVKSWWKIKQFQFKLQPKTSKYFTTSCVNQINCHIQQLLYALRQTYWPIAGRNLTRGITRNCLKCFKQQPKTYAQLMGQLPGIRINQAQPFFNTGIDFAGPFKGRDKRSRGYKTFKIYACLFICMATKAIHVESVGDLSTQSFLAAFRRFSSHRGKPQSIFTDNATNFVGAKAELNRMIKALNDNSQPLLNKLTNEGININWHFIPPRSPHFGGLWASHIKSIIRHLIRVSGEMIFTFEEFTTLLTQIEGVVNSRPLCPLSNDPNDLNPLTPAHF